VLDDPVEVPPNRSCIQSTCSAARNTVETLGVL
jgi:hypothetical protein